MATLIDQYNLAQNLNFQFHVAAAWVTAAIAVSNEVANEVQTISMGGTVSGGTFTITYAGTATAAIAFNANAATVQAALQAIATVGNGNVVATGGPLPGTPVVLTYVGSLGNLPLNLATTTSSLTGTLPTVTIARTTAGISVYNHATRAALARTILNGTGPCIQLRALAVASNATVQADFPGPSYAMTATEAQATSDIQFATNTVFGAFA